MKFQLKYYHIIDRKLYYINSLICCMSACKYLYLNRNKFSTRIFWNMTNDFKFVWATREAQVNEYIIRINVIK